MTHTAILFTYKGLFWCYAQNYYRLLSKEVHSSWLTRKWIHYNTRFSTTSHSLAIHIPFLFSSWLLLTKFSTKFSFSFSSPPKQQPSRTPTLLTALLQTVETAHLVQFHPLSNLKQIADPPSKPIWMEV